MEKLCRGLDHVGLAVEDLPAARRVFSEILGLRVVGEEDVPEQKVRIVRLEAGGCELEILSSSDPEGPVGRFLARRGPGIHHLTLRVADLPAALRELERRGVRLVDRKPRTGAGGRRIAFLHPASTAGILVELCEED